MAPVLIDWIDLVLPQDVPSDTVVAEWTKAHAICGTILNPRTSPEEAESNVTMAEKLEQILTLLPVAGRLIETPEGQPDDLAHDAYFHVRRVQSDEAAVFVRGALTARLVLLREAENSAITISRNELECIDHAFADLLSCLYGGTVNGAPHVKEWKSPAQTCNAQQRWVRGHLVFAALTQGLILSFRSLGQALRRGDTEQVRRWADLSISLLTGSGGAFIFTGDFPPEEYENTIRPSMTPPISAIGLSGLMSADHRFMAQTMRDMRPALKALAEQEQERHDLLSAAMASVYDKHIHVCERFVGPRPSILTAGRTERSGPSLIEQFKTLRMKPFEQSQRAPRLPDRVTVGECPFNK